MASPQPNEFTRLSNELLEALCKIKVSGAAMSILLVIFRKTYGFNKKKDRISLSQFSELTGIERSNCSRAVAKLESMNLITISKDINSSTYSIQKDYDLWGSVIKTDNTLQDKVLSKLNPSVVNIDNQVLSELTQSVVSSDYNKRKFNESFKESRKERATFLTSQNITSEKIKNLFANHSKITEPNQKIHVEPILKILETIPPEINSKDISLCLISVFSKLQKNKGVRMDFLLENIRKSISAKHEEVLLLQKQKRLRQEEKERLKEAKNKKSTQAEESTEYRKQTAEKIIKYSEFFQNNKKLFSTMEKYEIEKSFRNNSIALVENIFITKMEL
ncbi:MAG: replication protein [Melioribacteraceae bacterium]|jgi:phage replication O-like protein O|nr:replication protein [Melioribacteraceae bacterium]